MAKGLPQAARSRGLKMQRFGARASRNVVCRAREIPESQRENWRKHIPTTVAEMLSQGPQYKILNQTEDLMSEYCSVAEGDDQDMCYTVLSDLRQKHSAAEKKAQDPEHAKEAAEELDYLDRFVYDLRASTGSIKRVVQVLAHLRHKLDLAKSDKEAAESGSSLPVQDSSDDTVKQQRERLRMVYDEKDRNSDGYLSIGEFREALDTLGNHMDGQAVAEIIQTLGLEDRMDFDDFLAVVEVHCLNNESAESRSLRRLLHSHSHHDFKSWMSGWA